MKSLIVATVLAFGPQLYAAQPAEAYGACYHFYNCTGITYGGGYYSATDCGAMGGHSVQEGSYCENIASDNSAEAVKPQWFGQCYYSVGCIGLSLGELGDSQCQAEGGHSIETGGACINL